MPFQESNFRSTSEYLGFHLRDVLFPLECDSGKSQNKTENTRRGEPFPQHHPRKKDSGTGVERGDHRNGGQHACPGCEQERDVRAHVEHAGEQDDGDPGP